VKQIDFREENPEEMHLYDHLAIGT
jgi:hypothetical protein